MDLLKSEVSKHISLTDKEWVQFREPFWLVALKKKELMLKEGEVCKFEAFVNKGCFRVYHVDGKGEEHVLYFALEGWWVGDIDSFTNQVPAQLYIEALENSEVLLISKEDKDTLYETIPAVEKLFRVMGQKRIVSLQRRMIDNLSKTADQRYLDFISNYPQVAQRVTAQLIAAYLGISPEFLSKIRKKVGQKK